MKKLTLSLLIVMAVFVTGCVVTSVYPFYNEKDCAFEPALLGEWVNSTAPNQHWKFEKDYGVYRLTCTDDGKPTVMQAQPFKLEGQLFLDLSRTNSADEPFPPPIPSHVLLRVFQTSPMVRMAAPKYDWLRDILEKDSKALRHHHIRAGANPEDRYFVLTADTDELQRFFIKHLKTEDAWKDVFELKRPP